ncbi:hypothetical protein [Bradyrhizobium glycinis]|uniref:hypothetical protein n=1 Tax=Bradyrhizobium glycinis TaxID=2751812 RepID=UPI0018D8489B|nr:hypothetical protein [Bradyrhizobium glycinis]MBH5369027.1 hypothetical protein [Bradyrhizobium glycinis]
MRDYLNGRRMAEAAMSRNKNTRWTEDQETLLLELNAAGESPRLIAAKLERTERSVVMRLAQLKKTASSKAR